MKQPHGVHRDIAPRRKALSTRTGKPLTHGTVNTYNNHGCRCRECTDANTVAHNEYMLRSGRVKMTMDEWRVYNETNRKHGTPYTYSFNRCRCEACTVAAKLQRRRLRYNKAMRDGAFSVLCPDCGAPCKSERGLMVHRRYIHDA